MYRGRAASSSPGADVCSSMVRLMAPLIRLIGSRVFAASCVHLACCGYKGLEAIRKEVRHLSSGMVSRDRVHRIIIPHLYSLSRLAVKAIAAMNFALHAIKRGQALINDQACYAPLDSCATRWISTPEAL